MKKYPLTVEVNSRGVAAPADLKLGGMTLLVTPPLDEDFWLLRVPVGPKQAVVLFPKFSTYGIGFQHETDWNTNLPSACAAEKIYRHIRHNKADKSIPKARCLAAIRALQARIVELTGDECYRPVTVNGKEMDYWDAERAGLVSNSTLDKPSPR